MPKRLSRHGAFIEQIVTAINNGVKAKDLFRSSAYRNSEIPRRRHTEMLITSWKKNPKEAKRTNISRTILSTSVQIGSGVNNTTTTIQSMQDSTEPEDSKQEGRDGEKALEGTVQNRGEAINGSDTLANDFTSTTPKPEKHIHPCKCDLTPEQLKRIQEIEESRLKSKEQLQRRMAALREYFESKNQTSQRPTIGGATGKTSEEDEDDNDDRYLREQIERVRIIKKRPKRKPQERRQAPKRQVRRKKYRKPFKVRVGITLKINYKKPPLIPVKPTRTSTLRVTEHAYCPNKCYVPPTQSPPPGDGTFEIHYKASSEVPIRRNRTLELRLEKAKNWKPPPPEVFKYDRPPFEANTRIYKLFKPVKANIAT